MIEVEIDGITGFVRFLGAQRRHKHHNVTEGFHPLRNRQVAKSETHRAPDALTLFRLLRGCARWSAGPREIIEEICEPGQDFVSAQH